MEEKTGYNKSLESDLDLPTFMSEIYQITEAGTNVMDILSTMIVPEASGTKAVRDGQIASEKKKKRRKRDDALDISKSKISLIVVSY